MSRIVIAVSLVAGLWPQLAFGQYRPHPYAALAQAQARFQAQQAAASWQQAQYAQQLAVQRAAAQQSIYQQAAYEQAIVRQAVYQQAALEQAALRRQLYAQAAYDRASTSSGSPSIGVTAGVYYKPPFVPVKVKVGPDGLTIEGSMEINTPIGAIGIEGGPNVRP